LFVTRDGALKIAVFAGTIGGLAIVLWWAFFSRALLSERLIAIFLMIISLVVTSNFLNESIATANMGLMFTIFSIPVMSLAFVVWAVASRYLSTRLRRVSLVATIILASGFWAFLRTNGMINDLHFDFSWRWAKTQEERFLAKTGKEPMTLPVMDLMAEVWLASTLRMANAIRCREKFRHISWIVF
jgi:hypothetical protein